MKGNHVFELWTDDPAFSEGYPAIGCNCFISSNYNPETGLRRNRRILPRPLATKT